jgi:mono/diheme cytochrome c family protein
MRVIRNALFLAGLLAGCHGAASRGADAAMAGDSTTPAPDTLAPAAGVRPGIDPRVVFGPLHNPYQGDASAIATGRQLFVSFNCAGCHSGYAGGGMGPNLRDRVWIYGGDDTHVFASIAEGRPNGMPAWGSRIPREQIWQIIAYIRTLGTRDEPVKPPVASHQPPAWNPPAS